MLLVNIAKCSPDSSLWISNQISRSVFFTCYKGIVVLGYGPYLRKSNISGWFVLPREASDPCNLTQTVCEDINRKGTLCSQCMSGYTVSVNTYDLKCVPDKECNWFLTLLAVFGPLTIFYLIVFLFRINAAAPYISLVILLGRTGTSHINKTDCRLLFFHDIFLDLILPTSFSFPYTVFGILMCFRYTCLPCAWENTLAIWKYWHFSI